MNDTANKLEFCAVTPFHVEQIWPQVRPGIAKVLKHGLGLHTEQSTYEKIMSGEWMMFCVFEDGEPVVTIVASFRQGSEGSIFDVGMCWGTRVKEWISDVCAAFEQVAQECGCKYLAFNGRPGWTRMARAHHFKVNSMTFLKEV